MAKAEKYRLAEIVERFGGEVLGNPQTAISQVRRSARRRGTSVFSHANIAGNLRTSAGAVVLGTDSALTQLPRIVCDDPYLYFAKVSSLFNPPPVATRGAPTAVVERGTRCRPAPASAPGLCRPRGEAGQGW